MKGAATLTVGLAVAAVHGCDRDCAAKVPRGEPRRGAARKRQ
jgi:hypothetical protein